MSLDIKIYKTRDFIRKTAQGTINLERSLAAVRELAVAANHFKQHSVLLDLRDTELDGDHADSLQVAAAFAEQFKSFEQQIAVLVPDSADRKARAAFMRSCMHLQGFQWEFFTTYEAAIDWLSDIHSL